MRPAVYLIEIHAAGQRTLETFETLENAGAHFDGVKDGYKARGEAARMRLSFIGLPGPGKMGSTCELISCDLPAGPKPISWRARVHGDWVGSSLLSHEEVRKRNLRERPIIPSVVYFCDCETVSPRLSAQ